MLLIVGNEDKTVPYQQTLEMAELRSAGVPRARPHLDRKDARADADANLRALDATFKFIDNTMKVSP
jgi:hypothetical protein